MSAPLIGITSRATNGSSRLTGASRAYLEALAAAGAAPVIIPVGLPEQALRDLYERLDGLLFPGGGDISHLRLGVPPSPQLYQPDEPRDALEFTLVRWAVAEDKPFLGICRGVQVLNVALGGGLILDIASEVPQALPHDSPDTSPRDQLVHSIAVDPASRLASVLEASDLQVNSFHHQAVRAPAPGLKVVARAPDGVIEALELPDHPYGLGVQWHPEELPRLSCMQRLFTSLVEAAGGRRSVGAGSLRI
jgi:putative glutamine amidotransferase